MSFATAQDWARFLRPIVAAVRNPPNEADFKARCVALAATVRQPPEALTGEMVGRLCRKAEFWPSVAEIAAAFDAAWKERVAAAPSSPGPLLLAGQPAKPVDAVASLRNFRHIAEARQTMRAAPKVGTRPKALPLHPRHLLAQYEALAAEGNEAAAIRSQQLREAMGE